MKKTFILSLIILLFAPMAALCAQPKRIPYYASIKSEDAHIRTGPSVRYPIQWIYKRGNWPVQVTATFERWRKISDITGEVGWIHESLLTGARNVIINAKGTSNIYTLPTTTSAKIVRAEQGVIASVIECKNNWCKINVEDKKGWIEENKLWGVEEGEVVE